MSNEESSRQEPENPNTIPSKEVPMTKDTKTPEKTKGNDWIGILYMIVGFFVLIATFQLYFIIQDLIRTWVSDQFVPAVSAIYYLAVIIVGIWLLRDYIRRQ